MFHRTGRPADPVSVMVHVHGFGISGTYLEPTAALLARRHDTFVPDLPGMGRSIKPDAPLDLPGLAEALVSYCDVVGIERATFVGNSLGCPIIVALASAHPDRIDRAVLVSPAGGPNNQPLTRAVRQMAADGLREPPAMTAIATRDYLRFGLHRSISLFQAMKRYSTLEQLSDLTVPTLVVVGSRDPLVRVDRAHRLDVLPHVDAVKVPGAHALNFTKPLLIAELIEAHRNGEPLTSPNGARRDVETITIARSG